MEDALPAEIEREIFEWAFRISPSSALNLMLVAHRVHHWVASLMYTVVQHVVRPYSPPCLSSSYGPSPSVDYFGKFVKHLILGGPDKTSHEISHYLEACPNLVDLALWSAHPTKVFLDSLDKMLLERLSTKLTSLDEADFKRPAFSSITHLDITVLQISHDWTQPSTQDVELTLGGVDPTSPRLDLAATLTRWQSLRHLPRLTHIAINQVVDMEVIDCLLKHYTQLRILLIVNVEHGADWKLVNIQIDDPRFVMMELERYIASDWEDGAYGRPDMWSCAEAISLAKIDGRMKKEHFCTWFQGDEWLQQLSNLERAQSNYREVEGTSME